jgi:hypothetical protein
MSKGSHRAINLHGKKNIQKPFSDQLYNKKLLASVKKGNNECEKSNKIIR